MIGVRRARRAAAEERCRVARELHDGVLQQIAVLGYRVDDAADRVAPGPAREAVQSLRDDVARLAREVRGAVADLRGTSSPDRLGTALSAYVDEVTRRGGLRAHLHVDERGPRPPVLVERELRRVAQEAIANVAQHAHAVNLWVRFVTDDRGLTLVVEDDGVGTVAPRPGHYGLQGMRERAEGIGAAFTIDVRQDGGTIVILSTGISASLGREGEGDDSQRLARR